MNCFICFMRRRSLSFAELLLMVWHVAGFFYSVAYPQRFNSNWMAKRPYHIWLKTIQPLFQQKLNGLRSSIYVVWSPVRLLSKNIKWFGSLHSLRAFVWIWIIFKKACSRYRLKWAKFGHTLWLEELRLSHSLWTIGNCGSYFWKSLRKCRET